MTRSQKLVAAALAASIASASPSPASAQTATAPTTPPGLPNVPVTKIMAIGRVTAKWKPAALRTVMPQEVRETIALYLTGKIDHWFVRRDQPGVVFIFNAASVQEVHDLLEALPLGREAMMEFDLIPLGPLAPLGLLLAPAEPPKPR